MAVGVEDILAVLLVVVAAAVGHLAVGGAGTGVGDVVVMALDAGAFVGRQREVRAQARGPLVSRVLRRRVGVGVGEAVAQVFSVIREVVAAGHVDAVGLVDVNVVVGADKE